MAIAGVALLTCLSGGALSRSLQGERRDSGRSPLPSLLDTFPSIPDAVSVAPSTWNIPDVELSWYQTRLLNPVPGEIYRLLVEKEVTDWQRQIDHKLDVDKDASNGGNRQLFFNVGDHWYVVVMWRLIAFSAVNMDTVITWSSDSYSVVLASIHYEFPRVSWRVSMRGNTLCWLSNSWRVETYLLTFLGSFIWSWRILAGSIW